MKDTIKPIVLVLTILSFSVVLSAQSKFEFSFGLGQNYSTIVPDLEKINGITIQKDEYIFAPALIAQLGYKLTSKSKLVTRQTTQWVGGKIFGTEIYRTLNIRMPFQYHLEVLPNLRLLTGVSFSLLYDSQSSNVFFPRNNKFLAGYTGGITYTFKEKFELALSYNKDFSSFFEIDFTDAQGNIIDSSKNRIQYFQLAILYKIFG